MDGEHGLQTENIRWQSLCHIRNQWVTLTDEESAILTSSWNSGQRSAEYRLKNGLPMQVDFGAKDRGNGVDFLT